MAINGLEDTPETSGLENITNSIQWRCPAQAFAIVIKANARQRQAWQDSSGLILHPF